MQDPEMGWASMSLNTCSDDPLGWTAGFQLCASVKEPWEAATENGSDSMEGRRCVMLNELRCCGGELAAKL